MVHFSYFIINYSMVLLNILIFLLCFGIRRDRRIQGFSYIVVVFCFNLFIFLHPVTAELFERIPVAILWFFVLCFLFEGNIFAKTFIFFAAFFVSLFLYLLCSFVTEIFFLYESKEYYILLTIFVLSMFISYCLLVWRYGKAFCKKLFAYTTPNVWLLYMVLPITSLTIIGYCYMTQGIIWHPLPVNTTPYYILLPFFMFSCYVFIALSIINTHNRIEALHERDIARNILFSGQMYYERLTVLTENLQKHRHNYKFLLNTIQKLIEENSNQEAQKLFNTLTENTNETYTKQYCSNRVINALLFGYEERCSDNNIDFFTQIELTDEIDEYELCVIIGNLLENAVAAAKNTPENQKRYVDIVMRRHEFEFGIMVENSFNGYINEEKGKLLSIKSSNKAHLSGIGISSIKAMAKRHEGAYYPNWDDYKFCAYVVMKLKIKN